MYKIDISRIGAFAHPVVVEGGIFQVILNMLERDSKLSPIRGETLDVLKKRSHSLEPLIEHVPDHSADFEYKKWYEEAMIASNEAGYACVSAADTIRDLAREVRTLQGLLAGAMASAFQEPNSSIEAAIAAGVGSGS